MNAEGQPGMNADGKPSMNEATPPTEARPLRGLRRFGPATRERQDQSEGGTDAHAETSEDTQPCYGRPVTAA